MKLKHILISVALIIILIVVGMAVYIYINISNVLKDSYNPDFLKFTKYSYLISDNNTDWPTIILSENTTRFKFTCPIDENCTHQGEYCKKDGNLMLNCNDGCIFTFVIEDEETFIFVKEKSLISESVLPIPDGAEFTISGSTEIDPPTINIKNALPDGKAFFL